jgi:hypothetical protein
VEIGAHVDPAAAPAFWAGLRALAAARGLATVAGWLPMECMRHGYALAPLEKPLPMLASLDAKPAPADGAWWSIDHF